MVNEEFRNQMIVVTDALADHVKEEGDMTEEQVMDMMIDGMASLAVLMKPEGLDVEGFMNFVDATAGRLANTFMIAVLEAVDEAEAEGDAA